MSKLPNDERETHISMSSLRNKMKIYTTERHIMRRLDRYVEESDNWKVVDIGMLHGEVVSKTYEAPRDLLLTRKQKRVMTEEQRQKSAERLRALREKKHGKKVDEKADETDNDTGFGAVRMIWQLLIQTHLQICKMLQALHPGRRRDWSLKNHSQNM